MNPNTPPVDPVAIARDAAARAADATADAYRALAQVTRLVVKVPPEFCLELEKELGIVQRLPPDKPHVEAHPQGEPMPWDPPEQEAAAPVPAPAAVVTPEPESPPAAHLEPTPPPAVDAMPEPMAVPADGHTPTTPLTAEQQAQARGWVGSMSAAQRKAFATAFRHAFSVDPAEKSVAPLITEWRHYEFVDRFVIEAAGGVAP
jgi:hypothetical protein